MEIIHDIDIANIPSPCAATIGVFDGVHAGHRHLIQQMREQKKPEECSMVITFDELPQKLFRPDASVQLLTTLEEKQELIALEEVDYLVVLHFDRKLAALSAFEFMQLIATKLNVRRLFVGYDHHFGHDRDKGFADYQAYGRELSIEVVQATELTGDDLNQHISSSAIRKLIAEGHCARTTLSLMNFYPITGHVVHGQHIGTVLGYPTANLQVDNPDKLIPAAGVYAVLVVMEDGSRQEGMMNIGRRPTFGGQQTTLEVNIFDFQGDLYGHRLKVLLVARLRSEQRFETPEALIAQMEADKKRAIELFRKIQ